MIRLVGSAFLMNASLSLAAGLPPEIKNPLTQTGTAKSRKLETWRDPLMGMRFVRVPKGCFTMGRDEPLKPREEFVWEHLGFARSLSEDERPAHRVCLDSFWIGQHEVRASDWQLIMGEPPRGGMGDVPAADVSWLKVTEFLNRLNANTPGEYSYRLPTEAEWEYACRAGAKGDPVPDFTEWAATGKHRVMQPASVLEGAANPWGLQNMLGNVWEWVFDAYRAKAYDSHVLFQPVTTSGPTANRVIRGGGYRSAYIELRCSNRGSYDAASALPQIGFRIVRVSGGRK